MKKNIITFLVCFFILDGCVKRKKNVVTLDETKIVASATTVQKKEQQQEEKKTEQIQSPRFPAVIKAENTSAIGFQNSGIVTNINVKAGDFVKKEQLLAALDATEAVLALENAKIDLETKKILFQQEEKKYASYLSLFKSGSLSKAAFEDEENISKIARLNYAAAENNLKTKEQALKLTKITAPYDCVISKSYKSLGDFVTPGVPVFDVVQMNDLSVFAQIPFAFFEKIKIGMTLSVLNPLTNQKTKMVVNKIVPVIDAQTHTFDVYGQISRTNSVFIPGMYVEIILE